MDGGSTADVLHLVARAHNRPHSLLVMGQRVHKELHIGHAQRVVVAADALHVGEVLVGGVVGDLRHEGRAPVEDQAQLFLLGRLHRKGELDVRLGRGVHFGVEAQQLLVGRVVPRLVPVATVC